MISHPPSQQVPHSPESGETTKIGILDSGVGGLSVLLEIKKLLPGIDLDYIGDSAWCPYGNKSPAQIQQRILTLSRVLIDRGASLIVIACNSATIHAIETARQHFSIPFVGMEPGVKPATEKSRSRVIGVLATEASIAGEKFHHLLHTHAPPSKVKVITQQCPKFVDLVESGTLSGEAVNAAIQEYTAPMLAAGADTLVLGCTHYPFLKLAIQKQLGHDVALIDTGNAVARRVQSLLKDMTTCTQPSIRIQTTGDISMLERIFPTLCPDLHATLQALTDL